MVALDRVKALLATLPREDLAEISTFLDGVLAPPDLDALAPGPIATLTVRDRPGLVTYRNERVRCGKASCRRCPHGPYLYKYWREEGRLRKAYVGKGEKKEPRAQDARAGARVLSREDARPDGTG